MHIIDADFERRIDLPGVGPCPRPVDIDQQVTGFRDLVSLRVYSFAVDSLVHGDAEEDELFIVLLRGRIRVAVDQDGAEVGAFALDTAGAARIVFMPPGASYRLSTMTAADVAYARVRPLAGVAAAVAAFAPAEGRLDLPRHASGMAITLTPLAEGASVTLAAGGERLVHVGASSQGEITIGNEGLRPWQTGASAGGEAITLAAGAAPAEVLIVTARAG